jgi:hypothetical protein
MCEKIFRYICEVRSPGREGDPHPAPLYPLARTKPCLELTTYRCNRLQGFEIVFFSLLILFFGERFFGEHFTCSACCQF